MGFYVSRYYLVVFKVLLDHHQDKCNSLSVSYQYKKTEHLQMNQTIYQASNASAHLTASCASLDHDPENKTDTFKPYIFANKPWPVQVIWKSRKPWMEWILFALSEFQY